MTLKLRSHYRKLKIRPHVANTSYSPPQIASKYNFPTSLIGKGQKVGIIELGGAYNPTDLQQYMTSLGLPMPQVNVIPVNGATPTSDGPNGADGEVMLDIEVIASIAPGAILNVYFANNTSVDFASAVQEAITDGCAIISISWGGPEDQWSQTDLATFEASLLAAKNKGINVYVAAGDNGSGDGESGLHVDYPASSRWSIGVGGTSLPPSGPETVWNDGTQGGATGGGLSEKYPAPSYQPVPVVNGLRGVPDVSANADPSTGYLVQVDGTTFTIGGTSAAAPVWAAWNALANEANGGKSIGFLPPILYTLPANSGAFVDIVLGNNGQYQATPGYDLCTGIGRMDGMKLLAAVLAAIGSQPLSPVPQPPPQPSPPPTNPGQAKVTLAAVDAEFRRLEQLNPGRIGLLTKINQDIDHVILKSFPPASASSSTDDDLRLI